MKKKLLSVLLTLCMLFSLVPTMGGTASAAGTGESGSEKNSISSDTYSSLGLTQSATSDDLSGNPLGGGDIVCANPLSELYVNFNAEDAYGWSVQNNLVMSSNSGEAKGALEFYGADEAKSTTAYTDNKAGALYANGATSKDTLAKDLATSGHNPIQYSTSVAVSPDTGKKNYVAELTVDSENKVKLTMYSVTGSKTPVASVVVGTDGNLGSNTTGGRIYEWEYDALFDMAAGDMNGDGYDEIAVYANNKVTVYSTKDNLTTVYGEHEVVAPAGNSYHFADAVVALTMGDIDQDDCDELVIADSEAYGCTNLVDSKVEVLETSDGAKGGLAGKNSYSLADGNGYVRSANAAIGDINNDGANELVIAGYYGSDSKDAYHKDHLIYAVAGTGNTLSWSQTDYTLSKLQNMTDNTSQAIPPVSLACAATEGMGFGDQIFLAGCLYSYNSSSSLEKLTQIMQDTGHKKDGGGEATMNEFWIGNVTVGNFTNNDFGQEQIVYTYAMKHTDSDRYWYDIGYINKAQPGATDTNYYYGQEQAINCDTCYNYNKNVTRYGLYLSLAAVDTDNDSTLMKFDGKSVSYTNPEVYAVLQASPYFGDLDAAENYVKSGSTSYQTSKSTSSSVTTSGSLSVGAFADFEQDFAVLGVKLATIKAEVSTNNTFSHSFASETTKTVSIAYTGSAKNDYAVVYTVPYIDYTYDMWIPAQTVPSDDAYNTWITNYVKAYYTDPDTKHSGSELTTEEITKAETLLKAEIKAGDKVDGQWQKYTVSIPLKPVTTIITVDAYDAVAAKTSGLDPIRGNILNSTPGAPSTYTTTPGSGFSQIGDKQTSSSSAEGASATVSYAQTDGTSNSFNYDFSFDAKVGAGAGGVTVGVSAGFGIGAGGGFGSSKGVTYSGTVDNLPTDASNYFMYWTFGTSTAKLNNNSVIILCYQTSEVTQPPAVPTGLSVTNVTSDSVTLQWNKANGAAYYDLCYVNANGYSLVKRLKANASDQTISYTDTGLTPDSLHHYCVMSRSSVGDKSGYSATVEAYTLDANSGNFGITTQPGNTKVYSGGTATFTVKAQHLDTAGNTLTDVKYQWQYYDTDSNAWKNSGGSNTGSTYSVTGITSAIDGRQYRCYVYVSDTLYLYSNAVTLTVGLADSTTTLTASNGSTALQDKDTVNASYTTTSQESYDPKQYQQVAKTMEVSGKTYTCYSFTPSGGTAVDVWKDSDGKYYTYDGTKMTELTPVVKQTLDFNNGTSDVSLDITGDGTDYTTWKTTSGGIDYTSKTQYTLTGYTAYLAAGTNGSVKWFVVDSSTNVYSAEWNESTSLTIDGNSYDPVAVNMQPVMVNGDEIKQTVSTLNGGDTVTLTANVIKEQNADLDGKVTFTVSNSDGTYYKQFTADGSSGTASKDWAPDTAGVYTITASYGSDTHYAASEAAMTLYVVKPGESSLALSGSNLTYGNSLTMVTTQLTGNEAKTVKPTISSVTCDGAAVTDPTTLLTLTDSDLTFTPDKAGTYVITVTYTDGSTILTASKTVIVYDKTLTVTPDSKSTFKATGWTDSDSNNTALSKALTDAVTLTAASATDAGTYPVYASYTSKAGTTDNIDSRYTVVCKTGAYTVGDVTTHKVTASCGGNGSVQLEYTQSGLTIDAGTAADIPGGSKVVAVATPNNGYRLSGWKLDDAANSETSDTLTVEDALSKDHAVYAEFVPCAYVLTYGPKTENTGTVSAVYWDTDANTATTDPFSSGSKLTGFDSVQLTAVPAEGYYLKGWTTDDGNTIIAPTGSTYLVSGLSADKTVKAVFAQKVACTVTVTLKSGTQAVPSAGVSFNGTAATGTMTGGFNTYTYSGSTGDALTISITLPSGLIVTGWEGAGNLGTLSSSRKVLTIPTLSANANLTVNCSTPNSYAVTTTVSPDAADGTITAYVNGSDTPAANLSAIAQASSVRLVATPATDYAVSGWTVGGNAVTASSVSGTTNGSQEYTIDYLSGNTAVTVAFAQSVAITYDAPTNGTLTVTDESGNSIAAGAAVALGSKIIVTATPNTGYTLGALTINGQSASSGIAYTVTGDTTIAASFTAQSTPDAGNKPEYTLTFDTNGGSAIAAISKSSGTSVDLSAYLPTREGYSFGGWYADKDLTEAVSSVNLHADTAVYAKWLWLNPFSDVKDSDYFYDAVKWAFQGGITSGINETEFAPDMTCTRAQALTLFWRAAGSPEPTSQVSPFTDVSSDAYYYKAVLWGTEKGITKGTSDTTFSPDMECSRAQIMTFLWRANGSKAETADNPFSDVQDSDYYYDAVLWAVANKITNGTSANTYSPNDECSRAQIVTFLYRFMDL